MAHVQKFTRGSASRIIGHCEREMSEDGHYLKYRSSSDIDTSRTHLNIKLTFSDGLTAHERLNKRLDEVYVLNRKDVNVMCDWVITLPEGLPQDAASLKTFFSSSIKFLNARYGTENVVSCNIHMDEAQPHMHYCFVPVVYDRKKDRHKVCANDVITKKELTSFHTDLENHLHKEIGLEKGLIYSGKTEKQGGNKTIGQLKAESLEKEVEAANRTLLDYRNKIAETIGNIKGSAKWRQVKSAVDERDNYGSAPHRWFTSTSYVKDCKLREKRGKSTIEMPTEAFDSLFKLHELHFAWNSLVEIQNSLRNEIRALFEYEPDDLKEREARISEMEKDAVFKNRLLEQKISRQEELNEVADKLEKDNGRLKQTVTKLKSEILGLQRTLKEEEESKQFLNRRYEYLQQQYATSQNNLDRAGQKIKKLNSYEDMFERFPEMADEMKKKYQEQLQSEQRQREKEERKKRERERERAYEYTL